MSKIKSSNTKAEIKLRRALFSKGVRYRINNHSLFGKPDIAIKKYKLVVFIDGEFWHGKNWEIKRDKIKANRHYWIPKIEKNIARDIAVNDHYNNLGWTVIRLWEKEINQRLDNCVNNIMEHINKVRTIIAGDNNRPRNALF